MRRDRNRFGFVLRNRMDNFVSCRHPDTTPDSSPIVEIMRDTDPYSRHRGRDGYRIVRNGYAGLAGKDAIGAIEEVLNRMLAISESQSHYDHVRDRIHQMLELAYNNKVNLKLLAEDKVWPIFWGSMTIDAGFMDQLRYTRETARAKIGMFCDALYLTKKDWAWMCNREPFYLYRLMSMPLPLICVRWPGHLLGSQMGIPEMNHCSRFKDWLRAFFITNDGSEIRPDEFQMICRDVMDAEGSMLDMAKVYRAKTWPDFCRRLHDLEGRRHPYGRSPVRIWRDEASRIEEQIIRAFRVNPRHLDGGTFNTAGLEYTRNQMMQDMANYGAGAVRILHDMNINFTRTPPENKRPEPPEPFSWMTERGFPLSYGGKMNMSCRLLATTADVWDEADKMKHCLYRSYTSKMQAKDYVAYHFETPHMEADHKGWTVGFTRRNGNPDLRPGAINYAVVNPRWFRLDVREDGTLPPPEQPEKDKTLWVVDQVRGYKNSFNKDTALDQFVGEICDMLNAAEEKK